VISVAPELFGVTFGFVGQWLVKPRVDRDLAFEREMSIAARR